MQGKGGKFTAYSTYVYEIQNEFIIEKSTYCICPISAMAATAISSVGELLLNLLCARGKCDLALGPFQFIGLPHAL